MNTAILKYKLYIEWFPAVHIPYSTSFYIVYNIYITVYLSNIIIRISLKKTTFHNWDFYNWLKFKKKNILTNGLFNIGH